MSMLISASQIAGSLSNLKSRYIKYLETLCNANGIDISTLKTDGPTFPKIEIFFGGLPVLIGLKYFENLRVLRIFGQDIACLKPLAEVAHTLEELWMCEGLLKNLVGIETCKKIKRLYLYENKIEDCSPLSSLHALDILHLQDNAIKSLSFLHDLHFLTVLKLSGNNLTDSILLTATKWPSKLHHLELGGSRIASFKSLFTVSTCETLRSISVFDHQYKNPPVAPCEEFFSWLSFHFRFIENVDCDPTNEQFITNFLPLAENRLVDAINGWLKEEEKHIRQFKAAERHCTRIEHRLAAFVVALEKVREVTSPAKKEVIKRILEYAHQNVRVLKPIKKNLRTLTSFLFSMRHYEISLDLESSTTLSVHEPSEDELKIFHNFINNNCSWKGTYELRIKWCRCQRKLVKSDAERLFFVDCDETKRNFDERSFIDLMNRHLLDDFRRPPIRVFRDFELIRKEAKEKTRVFFVPIVLCKTISTKLVKSVTNIVGKTPEPEESSSSRTHEDDVSAQPHNEDSVAWKDLRVVAVCAIETCYNGQLQTQDLNCITEFEKKFDEQIGKLKDLHINLDLHDDRNRKQSIAYLENRPITPPTDNNEALKTSKIKKLKEFLNPRALKGRWSGDEGYPGSLSIRCPTELIFAYGRTYNILDMSEFNNLVTTLDMSNQKLTKLGGIEELTNLVYLKLSKNKLMSVKKLIRLPKLQYLDLSENLISKIDDLPELISELNISSNRISNLAVCGKLLLLSDLNCQRNHLKSLKGLEQCRNLKTLLTGENYIKDKLELDIFKNFSKLFLVDLSNNPITQLDTYRKTILSEAPSIVALDRERIPVEERTFVSKIIGKALTTEAITKICPNLPQLTKLNLQGHQFELVALETAGLESLDHIQEIDLSNNHLHNISELLALHNLRILDLSSNQIGQLCGEFEGEDSPPVLKGLRKLVISNNELTCGSCAKFGFHNLESLTELILSHNNISRLDCFLFDLPHLSRLDLSNNCIKTIRKKEMPHLKFLILEGNKLKDIEALAAPNLELLNISNNKISTCAAIKPISQMHSLQELICAGNPVTDRRVYVDFIKSQAPSLRILDYIPIEQKDTLTLAKQGSLSVQRQSEKDMEQQERMTFHFTPIETMDYNHHPLLLSISAESEVMKRRPSKLRPIDQERLVVLGRLEEQTAYDGYRRNSLDGFSLMGKKAVKHVKPL